MTIRITGYYGGKDRLAAKIIPLLPPHNRYCEPFCGFASVLLNKPRVNDEIIGDLNMGTVNALRAIRNVPASVIETLQTLEWGRELFEMVREQQTGIAAIAYVAMSHHRGGSRSGFSRQQSDRNLQRSWEHLYEVSDRLQGVKILNMHWKETIETLGKGDTETLIYLDPPYLVGGDSYQCSITPTEHEDLLIWAISSRCKVAISGYDSDLYQEYLGTWNRYEFPAKSSHRKEKLEVLWIKP